MDVLGAVTTLYRDFAAYAESSPCFTDWAVGVLDDSEMQQWLAGLPEGKRHPTLVFAAARWHGVPAPGPYAVLRDALLGDDGTIGSTIRSRSTQTNEVGRLATLLPALAQVSRGRPLALLEVGASAGLCLYPDRWGYTWRCGEATHLLGPAEPVLECEVTGPAPLPAELPRVVWRGGLDLNPLDVTDDEDMAWLSTLVWPEDHLRRHRLAAAIDLAHAEPPQLWRGDLLRDLAEHVARAAEVAPGAEVVVFHSAVLAYVDQAGRTEFDAMMRGLVADGRCHWISNEGVDVLPRVLGDRPKPPGGRFVLGIDGDAVADTHGHGSSLRWW